MTIIDNYKGYEIHCDEDGTFAAKKTPEAFDFRDYKSLHDLEDVIDNKISPEDGEDVTQLVFGIVIGIVMVTVFLILFKP